MAISQRFHRHKIRGGRKCAQTEFGINGIRYSVITHRLRPRIIEIKLQRSARRAAAFVSPVLS